MTVLHIGFRKCASTSIQTFLATNRKELASKAGLHVMMPREIAGLVGELMGRKAESVAALARLADSFAAIRSSGLRPLVSDEMLETLDLISIERLSRTLAQDPVVVAIIRDPRELVVSLYKFRTMGGLNTHGFDAFSKRIFSREDRRLYFTDTLAKWAAVFGWASVRVIILGGGKTGNLYSDFLSATGSDLGANAQLTSPSPKNTTTGWIPTEFLRARFARIFKNCETQPEYRAAKTKIIEEVLPRAALLDDHPQFKVRGEYLTEDQIADLTELFLRQRDSLNQRYAGDIVPERMLSAEKFQPRFFLPSSSHIARSDRELLGSLFQIGRLSRDE